MAGGWPWILMAPGEAPRWHVHLKLEHAAMHSIAWRRVFLLCPSRKRGLEWRRRFENGPKCPMAERRESSHAAGLSVMHCAEAARGNVSNSQWAESYCLYNVSYGKWLIQAAMWFYYSLDFRCENCQSVNKTSARFSVKGNAGHAGQGSSFFTTVFSPSFTPRISSTI